MELLLGLVLHLLSDSEHVHGGDGDGHPVVLAADAWHVGVDDLPRSSGGQEGRRIGRTQPKLLTQSILCTLLA